MIASRLIPYKRIDLAVEAFNRLKRPLWIAGDGRDVNRLRAMAGPTIRFVGRVPDADLPGLMARCKAFVFPGHEDFGIAPVEAQAAGRPVIAFGAGGALDTGSDGPTGVHFAEHSVEALVDAVERLDTIDFDPDAIRAHAARFDTSVFRQALSAFIETKYAERATR